MTLFCQFLPRDNFCLQFFKNYIIAQKLGVTPPVIMKINFFQNKNTTIYSIKINNKHYILWFLNSVGITKPQQNTKIRIIPM